MQYVDYSTWFILTLLSLSVLLFLFFFLRQLLLLESFPFLLSHPVSRASKTDLRKQSSRIEFLSSRMQPAANSLPASELS